MAFWTHTFFIPIKYMLNDFVQQCRRLLLNGVLYKKLCHDNGKEFCVVRNEVSPKVNEVSPDVFQVLISFFSIFTTVVSNHQKPSCFWWFDTLNNKLPLIIYFFNTMHLCQSIKITDNKLTLIICFFNTYT